MSKTTIGIACNPFAAKGQDIDGDGNLEMVLRIDRPLLDLDGNQEIKAAFMRGVVEVYPIGRQ